MRIRAYNIDYCIEDEDVADLVEDEENIGEKIKELKDELPQEIYIENDFEDFDEDDFESIEDFIADEISDETGWLVNDFHYEFIGG